LRNEAPGLDEIDLQILSALQGDARVTMRELGGRVGLSAPAAADRVRRLEFRGVIRGYRAEVVPGRVGLPVVAFLTVGMARDVRPSTRLEHAIESLAEVLEGYRITGEDAYLLKVAVADMDALRDTIDRLSEFGPVKTSVVLAVSKWPGALEPAARRSRGPVFRHGAD
jgi:Lrp/AsnC family transcriptional regulator, leucine-responsive regulatory protein